MLVSWLERRRSISTSSAPAIQRHYLTFLPLNNGTEVTGNEKYIGFLKK